MGLDPAGTPILLRDIGDDDFFSLKLERR